MRSWNSKALLFCFALLPRDCCSSNVLRSQPGSGKLAALWLRMADKPLH
jgi:hypothetical protein